MLCSDIQASDFAIGAPSAYPINCSFSASTVISSLLLSFVQVQVETSRAGDVRGRLEFLVVEGGTKESRSVHAGKEEKASQRKKERESEGGGGIG